MPKIHSDITDQLEIHVPKGFTEAANDTALTRSITGTLQWRSTNELGGTGPQGPAGPAGPDDIARHAISTGLLSGGVISINVDPTKFDISETIVVHVDHTTTPGTPIVNQFTVPATTGIDADNIGVDGLGLVGIDSGGNIVQSSTVYTSEQRRDIVTVGGVLKDSGIIVSPINSPISAADVTAQYFDLLQAFGVFNIEGNDVVPNANLSVDKNAGKIFSRGSNWQTNPKDPNTTTLPAQSPASLVQTVQTGTLINVSEFIDPTQWDNGGVLNTVPANNDATLGRIYMFPNGDLQYFFGQQVYNNLAAAVDAAGKESFILPATTVDAALLIARVAVRKDALDLSNSN